MPELFLPYSYSKINGPKLLTKFRVKEVLKEVCASKIKTNV